VHTQYEDELELELEEELEGEDETEWELEGEWEWEGEDEGEEFLGSIARGLGRSLRQCLPAVRRLAGPAAGLVASAVQGAAGPVGAALPGAGAEADLEWEAEELVESAADLEGGPDQYGEDRELEYEFEDEAEWESEDEATAPLTPVQATAELMAAVAASTGSESEAEAMVAGATALTLSRAQRVAVRRLIPQLVRGAITLARILRRRPGARHGLRILPTVMRRTVITLDRRAAAGRPVTRRTAAGVMAGQTRRVLGNPQAGARALQRNVYAARAASGLPPASPGVRRPRQLA
jgi:hypothetical protein